MKTLKKLHAKIQRLVVGGPSRQPTRRARLRFEVLEQRDVPTVIFTPVFGAETIFWRLGSLAGQAVTSPITNNPTVLKDPQVYLIFEGSSWTNTRAAKWAADAQTIIGSSYLSGLKQYGSDGHAIFNPSTDWTIDTGYDNGATTAPRER